MNLYYVDNLERDMQTIYIADMAHQSIIIIWIGDNKNSDSFDVLVNGYDGQPILGPNCIINSSNMSIHYIYLLGHLENAQLITL